MKDYIKVTWTGDRGLEEAQTDKGLEAIKEYGRIGIGSGKLILTNERISKDEFERNKKRGITTI